MPRFSISRILWRGRNEKAGEASSGALVGRPTFPDVLWFLDADDKRAPHAQLTGVQKAPRHEVAGSWAPAKQRALCGFDIGAALVGKRDASARRRHVCMPEWWHLGGRVKCSNRRAAELIDGYLLREATTWQNASTTSAFWHEGCTRRYF